MKRSIHGAALLALPLALALALGCSHSTARAPAAPAPATTSAAEPAPAPADQPDASLDENAVRYADMLLAEPGADDGTARAPGSELSTQIAGVGEGDVGGGTTPRYGTGATLAPAPSAPPAPPAPAVELQLSAHVADRTSLDEAAIVRKVRTAYGAGLQRCFRRSLAAGGPDSATIELSFTVDASGRVVSPTTSSSADVSACAAESVVNWRFDPPLDTDGERTELDVVMSMRFVHLRDRAPAVRP